LRKGIHLEQSNAQPVQLLNRYWSDTQATWLGASAAYHDQQYSHNNALQYKPLSRLGARRIDGIRQQQVRGSACWLDAEAADSTPGFGDLTDGYDMSAVL
jgi:hypothetical protein